MSIQLINRNNVVAGVFLILSIVLAVSISFILTDVQDKFTKRIEYTISFPTDIGVAGLGVGAEVTFGGLSVGKVKSIKDHIETDPETGAQIVRELHVGIVVRSDLVLYEDAFADLTLPLLGGVSRVNIASAGTGSYAGGPADANAVLDPGEMLRGRFAPSILTQLGFTTEESLAIKETIHEVRAISENVSEVSQSMKRMVQQFEPGFGQGVEDGKGTMANIRAFSEKLNDGAGWSGQVDSILSSADDAAKKFVPVVEDARATVTKAGVILDENRPKVTSILDNANASSERFRVETIDKVSELLDKGTLALGSYKDVADNANGILLSNSPKISTTLSLARDIGVQGQLFLEEVRSQPWRLLKKPSADDLRREPIYEAARSYAGAVSDLRAASEALDAAVLRASQNPDPGTVAQIREIAGVVDEAYSRYDAAERALLERLRTTSPTTHP